MRNFGDYSVIGRVKNKIMFLSSVRIYDEWVNLEIALLG